MRAEPITFTYIVRNPETTPAEDSQALAIGDSAPQVDEHDSPVARYNFVHGWPSVGGSNDGQQDVLKADVDSQSEARQAPQGVLALLADGHTR